MMAMRINNIAEVDETSKNNSSISSGTKSSNDPLNDITHRSIISHQQDVIIADKNSIPIPSPSSPPSAAPPNKNNNEEVGAKLNENISAAITAAVQPTAMNEAAETDAWRVGVSHSEDNGDLVAGQAASNAQVTAHETSANEMDRATRLGMMVKEKSVLLPTPESSTGHQSANADLRRANSVPVSNNDRNPYQSLLDHRLFDDQAAQRVEPSLAASCEALGFDIAEMWLRTGGRSHQLIASYLRPTALDETTRNDLTELYYGVDASSRTHRFSPALCKKAKDVEHVIWVPDDTAHGAQALSCSLSNVKTAVAVPVTHQATNTNFTIIYFSLRKTKKTSLAIEFLMHMSLATAITAVNTLNQDLKRVSSTVENHRLDLPFNLSQHDQAENEPAGVDPLTQSEHRIPEPSSLTPVHMSPSPDNEHLFPSTIMTTTPPPTPPPGQLNFNIDYGLLRNREYLTDGTNAWVHTAVMNKEPVVIKELKPECEDDVRAINEIEEELAVHSKLRNRHICAFLGAGLSAKGTRFIVLERLDGGTLGQLFGYKSRIRDRRKRFARRKKKMSSMEVLKCALAIAEAMNYCHWKAIPGSMVIHRDLKPDNIGFALDGTVKILDFGLSTIVGIAIPDSDEVYDLSGETGSLRYMAPEVASDQPYNHKVDVYSFGMIAWELLSYEKPFDGMDRQKFYEKVVYGGERPPINRKIPAKWAQLMTQCWSVEAEQRPEFSAVAEMLKEMIHDEENKATKSIFSMFNGNKQNVRPPRRERNQLAQRHSTWF